MMATATATATATAVRIDEVLSPVVSPISPILAKMKEQFLRLEIPISIPTMPLAAAHSNVFREPATQHVDLENPEITCWLLDTRSLWPGDNILSADGAAKALSLISLPEQNVVTTKMFIADAKMSLGSALLKRLFISKTLGIPWKDVKLARRGNEKHGKPCAVDDTGRSIDGIDFNVSHQNGLVALIGWNGQRRHRYSPGGHIQGVLSPRVTEVDVMVGVDIVCVNEKETATTTIDEEGFENWVDIYDQVFSDEERFQMKYFVDYVTLLDGSTLSGDEIDRSDRIQQRNQHITLKTPSGRECSFSSELVIDAKLRRFYTYFCYKEAYIKLAGEALLAPWLKQLEFFNVRSPKPGTIARCSTHGTWGEEIDDVEVKLHRRVVEDVKMKVQAFEEDFMFSTAIQGNISGLKIPSFQNVNLQKDILAFAGENLDTFKRPAPEVKDVRSPVDLMSPWESRYWS